MSQAYFVAIAWHGLSCDLRYQARDSTQEHSAGIRKLAIGDGDRFCRKNTMPYFLARLEGLAGLRPLPSNDWDGVTEALGSIVIVVILLLVHVSINCWDLLAAIGARAGARSE